MAAVINYFGEREVERRTGAFGRWNNKFWLWDDESLAIVLAEVHPGNLGELPPEPGMIAARGRQIGLVSRAEELQGVRLVRSNGETVTEQYLPPGKW